MTIPTLLEGSKGNLVQITQAGSLHVVNPNFDMGIRKVLDSTGVAFNHVEPKSGKKFIITGLVINADKSVTSSAVTNLIEADSTTDATGTKSLLTIDVPKNETIVITGIQMETNTGVYLNSKTDDATVNYMILGFFIGV